MIKVMHNILRIVREVTTKKRDFLKLKKIIKSAKYYNEVDALHNKFNRFRYYEMPVRYENAISFITVNVGKGKTDGKYHIYDLTKPKERNTPNRINGFGRPVGNALGKGVSNYSIPNTTETVKKKFSLPENVPTTDSRGVELSKGQQSFFAESKLRDEQGRHRIKTKEALTLW